MEIGKVAGDGSGSGVGGSEVEIYPLCGYYFGSKVAAPKKDANLSERTERMNSNYAAVGMRTCVEGVLLLEHFEHERWLVYKTGGVVQEYQVELFQRPHVLLLQVRNSFFKLPGGRLRPGESDIEGLKRKLSSKLSCSEDGIDDEWQIGECIGIWWKTSFETLPYPYLPPSMRRPKECTKLFLVRLPMTRQFAVPRNMKLLAVPLHQIYENNIWSNYIWNPKSAIKVLHQPDPGLIFIAANHDIRTRGQGLVVVTSGACSTSIVLVVGEELSIKVSVIPCGTESLGSLHLLRRWHLNKVSPYKGALHTEKIKFPSCVY